MNKKMDLKVIYNLSSKGRLACVLAGVDHSVEQTLAVQHGTEIFKKLLAWAEIVDDAVVLDLTQRWNGPFTKDFDAIQTPQSILEHCIAADRERSEQRRERTAQHAQMLQEYEDQCREVLSKRRVRTDKNGLQRPDWPNKPPGVALPKDTIRRSPEARAWDEQLRAQRSRVRAGVAEIDDMRQQEFSEREGVLQGPLQDKFPDLSDAQITEYLRDWYVGPFNVPSEALQAFYGDKIPRVIFSLVNWDAVYATLKKENAIFYLSPGKQLHFFIDPASGD